MDKVELRDCFKSPRRYNFGVLIEVKRFWMLDVGCWILDFGFWIDPDHKGQTILDLGFWIKSKI